MTLQIWRLMFLGPAYLRDLERNKEAADRLDRALRGVLEE